MMTVSKLIADSLSLDDVSNYDDASAAEESIASFIENQFDRDLTEGEYHEIGEAVESWWIANDGDDQEADEE